MPVNNVIRMLESRKIAFQAFETPIEELGAQGTAEFLKIPINLIYKTIVVKRESSGKPVLAIVPGNCRVDLKLLAAFLGEKKLLLTTKDEAEKLTGLQTGGISPLALINKGFTMILDETAREHETIHISGGMRGLNIRLPVKDLIEITGMNMGNISSKIGD